MEIDLSEAVGNSAFALRGYNVTNMGRSDELLRHAKYGPLVSEHLRAASQICRDVLCQPVDLEAAVLARRPSTLETFGEDTALILAMEMAQIECLEAFFDVRFNQAKLALGYSLGEVGALACAGVFHLEDVLPALLSLSAECAELARDVTMGVLFSRGPALDVVAVERLCIAVTAEGQGTIAISSYLSPNTVLLLGQAGTVDRFHDLAADRLPGKTYLRKNSERWPPLHTSILWAKCIPNRAAVMMQTAHGGLRAPTPPVISLVTGTTSYNDYNARQLMNEWIDHPQRLWDAIYETLVAGVETMIHVGPEPNLLPATFKRISDNVKVQLSGRSFNSFGLRAISSVWRPWLTKVLSSRTALLQAPFVKHVVLEDWLLANDGS